MTTYHLAQLNIGRMLGYRDDPIVAGFFARLDEINALAEAAPGFVWRLQTEEGDATSIHAFDDDLLLINMSVWESVETLHQFAYYSQHVELYRQRQEWFHKLSEAILVMWWIPAGTIPTIEEAKAKLEHLRQHGATPEAFNFKNCFSPQGEPVTMKGVKTV
ncbi:MAG TPA: DUF3291 domain-containing protein [Phototrophicaceae bacterium]|jgi:hypothetical protein|nr:DUF3291 domain-containing protein [Phototrophicaceae bacterium]